MPHVAPEGAKCGEMAEWLKALAWKASIRETVSWVRIPLSPFYKLSTKMKFVIQRVSQASVTVNGSVTGQINQGLLILTGFGKEDTQENFPKAIDKIVNMRIFSNDQGRFDKSVSDTGGGILLVPQFTLFADTRHGRRPEFFSAMEPARAEKYFLDFTELFRKSCSLQVETGLFGADMKVSLLNDGPVTIILEL